MKNTNSNESFAQPINAAHMETDPLVYPIYCLEPGVTVPPDQTCYILASNGLWFQKTKGIMRGIVSVDGISHLESITPSIAMNIANIPATILMRALVFFRRVYNKHHAEAELQLFYNRNNSQFDLFCPEQTVSYGSVDYKPDQWEDPNQNLQDYLLIGTIHSHCNFGASHSNIDLRDERYAEGIHITIGHVMDKEFSLSCSIQMGRQRLQLDPRMKLTGLELVQSSLRNYTDYYRLILPMSKRQLKELLKELGKKIDKNWMPKVQQKSYLYSGHYSGGWSPYESPSPAHKNSYRSRQQSNEVKFEQREEPTNTKDYTHDEEP